MTTATVKEMGTRFGAFVKASRKGPVVVTENGKPVAVLVGESDEDEIERLLMAYSPKLRAILDSSREQVDRGLGIEHEQFWREMAAEGRQKSKRGARHAK